MDGVLVTVLQGIWWEVTVTTEGSQWDFLFRVLWYGFLRSVSLQAVFAEKAEENTIKNEKIWTKVILTKVGSRDSHFTVDIWRAIVFQSTRTALAGQ